MTRRRSARATRLFRFRLVSTLIPALITAHAINADAREASEVFARGFGSKAAAMGNSFVSIADDASAVYWNPAGAGWIPRKTISFSFTDMYFADIDYSSVSYVHPVGGMGAMGLSLTRWNVEGIEMRDDNNLLLDDDLSDTQMELIASYSTPPVRNLTAALGVKLDTQAMGDKRAHGVGLDLGLLYRCGARRRMTGRCFSAGISVKNLVEPVLELDEDRTSFPTRAVFSTAYGGGRNRYLDHWVLSVDLNAPSDVPGGANFGLEASIKPVSFRAGSLDGRLTAGIGTVWEGLSFDYAYSEEDYGRLHTFSLGISFGDPAPELVARRQEQDEETAAQ